MAKALSVLRGRAPTLQGLRPNTRGGRIHHAYDALGRVERRWATAPGSLLPVRFDDPDWSSAATPGQPERITVEKAHLYNEEQELGDTLDRRRGWLLTDPLVCFLQWEFVLETTVPGA